MQFRICWVFISMLLVGCNIMPGLQNPSIGSMQQVSQTTPYTMTPILVPITPTLIANQKISKYVYRIAPADILNINVWQHPEFTPRELQITQAKELPSTQGAAGQEGYLVNTNGFIYFPLVGNVKVSDKTVDEVRQILTMKLRRYIKNPSLNVRVVDFRGRKIYVLGEVMKPSFIPLNDQPLSITDAISMTGGFDPSAADPSHIYVIRGDIYHPYVYWLNAKSPESLLVAEHFHLKPGDILFVSSAAATRWNRVLNQLLPTIQTVWYTKAIINNN